MTSIRYATQIDSRFKLYVYVYARAIMNLVDKFTIYVCTIFISTRADEINDPFSCGMKWTISL